MFGLGGPKRPEMVVFDVIGTVFPLEPLRSSIVALGCRRQGWKGGLPPDAAMRSRWQPLEISSRSRQCWRRRSKACWRSRGSMHPRTNARCSCNSWRRSTGVTERARRSRF